MQLPTISAGRGFALLSRPDPAQAIAHQTWCRARNQVLAHLAANRGPIAVIDQPGTGKTLLLATLAELLREADHQVRLIYRPDLELDCAATQITLIDEIDKIGKDDLLRFLQNAGTCICAGLPSVAQTLSDAKAKIAIVTLAPLLPEEVRPFIETRLKKSGLVPDYLAEDAAAAIAAYSAGIPRVVNSLLLGAAVVATAKGAKRVSAEHVGEAIAMRGDAGDNAFARSPGFLDGAEQQSAASQTADRVPYDLTETQMVTRPTDGLGAVASVTDKSRAGYLRQPRAAAAVAGCSLLILTLLVGRLFFHPPQPVGTVTGSTSPVAAPSNSAGAAGSHRAETRAERDVQQRSSPSYPGSSQVGTRDGSGPNKVSAWHNALALVERAFPRGAAAQIVVTYERRNATDEAAAARLAAKIRGYGLVVGDPVAVSPGSRAGTISYFFAEDHDAAADTAKRLKGEYSDVRLAPISRRDLSVRPGTVVISIRS